MLSLAELALQHARALASNLRAQQAALSRAGPSMAPFVPRSVLKYHVRASESDLRDSDADEASVTPGQKEAHQLFFRFLPFPLNKHN